MQHMAIQTLLYTTFYGTLTAWCITIVNVQLSSHAYTLKGKCYDGHSDVQCD